MINMLELVLISQINKLIWFQYNSTGCLTCHNTPIERINDSIYVLGSFHYNKSGVYILKVNDETIKLFVK
ncbi:MAG: hypothetical protein N2504_06620 [candidate division WOR-3 bacterium]|nr:hypothetical protein [candidate division WOR-3 bacterium]